MSWADKVRDNVNREKGNKNSKDEVREAFNHTTLKLIKQFADNVEMGAVEVRDMNDMARLYNIFMSINDLENGEEGSGRLPGLPRSQVEVFGETVNTIESDEADGEDQDFIDEEAFNERTAKDIEKMLLEREKAVNETNEGTF